jgi:hypothetical protein
MDVVLLLERRHGRLGPFDFLLPILKPCQVGEIVERRDFVH